MWSMIIVGNGALVLLLQIEQASDGEIHSLHSLQAVSPLCSQPVVAWANSTAAIILLSCNSENVHLVLP